MGDERRHPDERVLLLAPTARDGEATRGVLASAGIGCLVCPSLDHLCQTLDAGAAAVVVPEEVVLTDEVDRLAERLRRQPVWSDLPVIVLSRAETESPAVEKAVATLGNVSLIERPMRVSTLLSVVRAAMRARARQYEVRDHLEGRKRSEAVLRESERRFRALVNASADAVFRVSPDWSEMRHLDGRGVAADASRPTASWLDEHVHPADRPRVAAAIDEAVRGGGAFESEHRVRRADGTVGWALSRAVPLLDDAGRVAEWIGTASDVTERRRDAELLAAQNHALEVVAGDAPLGEALAALARIVAEQSAGQAVSAILLLGDDGRLRTGAAPDLPPEYCAAIDGISAAEGVGTCCHAAARDETVVTPDIAAAASWRGLSHLPLGLGLRAAWSMPIRASDGRVLGTFGTYFRECRGPTPRERQVVEGLSRAAALAIERRRAEAAMAQNEKTLRVALRAAELGTWTYAFADGRWELDERAQRLYGTDGPVVCHDEALMRRIMHPDDARRMWECVRSATDPAGSGRYHCEYRVRRAEGGYRWLAAWGHVEFEGRGPQRRASRMTGSTRDVTAARDAERELREAKEAAERASEAKSEFLATLSHELRTPLTPVLLTVSLMESHAGLPADLREDVATIRRNVELESRLISDLLDLTRIERGKLQLDEQDVDLHLIVRSAIDICQREASARLVLDLRAGRHAVRGDSTRLQQVFWNLINNAIKFTPPDGTVTVRSFDAPGGRVRVEVSDTGAGIDPAVLPKLFSAFEQGEVRVARQQAGLGLGLAISKRLAEAHEGTITAASAGRGRGATFTVELPAIDSRVGAAPPRPRTAPSAAARPLKVLLVEDHEPTLRVMEKLLRQIGHRVMGVTSVASATAAAGRDGYDVIISDLGLPDGSGLDVIRELRDRYAGRSIALTGYGMESDIAASRAAGFAEHLTKPVDLSALTEAISRVTRTAGS